MHLPLTTSPWLNASASGGPHGFGAKNPDGGGPGSQLRQWSSIIGIVTAIVGNVIISIALNTQRYAHLRIDREYHESRPSSPEGNRKPAKSARNYGTATQQQEAIAEERARLNARAPGPNGSNKQNGKAVLEQTEDESEPLKQSFESEATLRTSEKDTSADDDDSRKSYLRSPYWWVGIILMTVGEAGNFLAYGFAPASIVSPLGVVALISNCVIAPFMLKERFRQRDGLGVLVAIAGAVTVVLSAKQSETKLGPDELWETIKRWEFLLYVGITVLAIIGLMLASPRYGSRSIFVNLGLVGLYGGYTALSTKGVASLLSDSLWRAFTFPIIYFLIVILVLSAIMQIRYLNRALQTFDSTQVIPTQFVLFTLSVIIGSAVLYRDFESATADRVGKFIGGCLLTFFGVYFITSGRRPNEEHAPEDYGDEEEAIHLIDEEVDYVDEQTPLQEHPSSEHVPRPQTPDQAAQRRSSGASSPLPPVTVTPEPSMSTTSLPQTVDNPWVSSNDLPEQRSSKSQPDVFKTPRMSRLVSENDMLTPYYTPTSGLAERPTLQSHITSPADPETPTKRQRRTASPPKPDAGLRAPETPNSSSFARSARGSISRLLPGPLLTPLSSSLSAVVADSLLRGEGSPRPARANLRRFRSERVARSSPAVDGPPSAAEYQSVRRSSVDLDPAVGRIGSQAEITQIVEEEGGDVGTIKKRLRAMSDSVGGLLGKVTGRQPEADKHSDGGGPSAEGVDQDAGQASSSRT